MNKQDFILIMGWFVTSINLVNIFNCTFALLRFFWKSAKEENERWRISLYFTLTLLTLAFFGANCLALYRFYDNWIVKHLYSTLETILNGFGDRILMLIVSICLVIISKIDIPRHKPDKAE